MEDNKNLRYLLLLCLSLIYISPLYAEYFKYVGLSEGLPQPSVMAIHQDRLGRMWFGTREGISRYDGNRVKVFKGWINAPGGEPAVWLGNEVAFIVSDSLDNLYFSIDKNLVRYDIRTERFIPLTDEGLVTALTSFEGRAWYMKHDSLFCLKADEAPAFVLKTNITARICCLTMMDNEIAVGTSDGVYLIDRHSHRRRQLLEGLEIYRIFESSQKELWIGTRMHGLYRTNGTDAPVKVPYSVGSAEGISSEQIRDFVEDNEGDIWFGTFDGLHRYSSRHRQYSLIQIPQYMGGLNHPSIFALYKDVAGTIWVGSYYGGVNYFNPHHDAFVHYDYGKNINLYYSYIGEIVIDNDDHLWLSTDGGGIVCVDKKWNTLRQFTASGGNSIPHNNVKSICYDEQNNCLYIGTYLGGLSRYDLATGTFRNYYREASSSPESPDGIVYHVKMWKGQVYISAHNGFFRLDTRTQMFHRLDIPFAYYEHFDIDEAGNLYLVGWKKVVCTHVEHPEAVSYIELAEENCKATSTRVLATDEGVYVATLGMGLFFYDRRTHRTTHYTSRNSQLPGDFCYNLCRTPDGKVLVTGDKGVTCHLPSEGTFTTIDLMSNFPSTHIINGCGILVSRKGNIYVGDTKGVTVFSENEFNKNGITNETSDFYFSELWVNNRMIAPGDDTHILSQSLPYTRSLRLRHDRNNLIIHFALSDYGQQLSEKWFQYRLEGFDKNWIRTKQNELYYTNLDPGTYTLHVALINEKSGQALKTITLQLVISSPWYNTWWAWIVYVVVFAACISYYLYSKIAKRTLALSLEKERFEKQQIEQLNQAKLVFFTNVSHEFRTPLTLIISHIDVLLQKYSLHPSVYNQIAKIRKNAQQMNRLISELLEFRKLEQNYGTIQIKQQDIIAFLQEIYLSFADYAQQRNIRYEFKLPQLPVSCWFEWQLMEKVFFNLLSNAFKYTSDKGSIVLSGEVTNSDIKIHITDTGIGISEQNKDRIFARFFQGDNRDKQETLFGGTGIGLALTRTIVEKHHGEITVESAVGEGSTFTVRLPRRKDVFLNDKNVQFVTQDVESDVLPGSMPVFEGEEPLSATSSDGEEETAAGDKTHTVLLVEDNEELLQILKELFEPFYRIVCARNGKEGLAEVCKSSPDLVISDVMMPEMTGTEMCLQIKNNLDLCHIPVILLTALNSTEQNIEGLSRGADDYITKPFHAQLLLARANNLIRSRLLMQHQFDKKPMSEIDLTSINPLDKDLLKRASQVIEKHIDDTEFDIPALCREVGVGRSLLYTKFKALTGMTPNNFLLNYRLKHAATLLQQYPDLPIAEVSDRSGFNAPVYFSRCFKNHFGCTPQNYRREQKQQDKPERQ
ncbi:hybrid sensor histidine kinase/response regulator transcription factor [uncultured Bacteroides sp.]|uniref:hybrid sensor histidine kinase/response regulator transcription factor n=1 Tax=uncultured Bacteroides sp. TaxID=162156 RepID=UPI0025D646C6|nr:hybrid sensor histidine kinase/response regulator transcription factor [uncultured Bacteroides sp.]